MARLYSLLLSASLVVASLLMTSVNPVLAAASTTTTPAKAKKTKTAPTKFNVIVTMKARTESVLDDIKAKVFASRGKRAIATRDGLETHAKHTQKTVFDLLEKLHTTFSRSESFWLTNQIFVEGASQALIDKLSKLPDVLSVAPEQVYPLVFPTLETSATSTSTVVSQWGVAKVRAPDVWATGNTGKGVVVGIIDTGVRATHKDLAGQYRYSYGWYDPPTKTTTPYDATGHGTHVAGIIAGANGIGVAPGAQFIMCKGCRSDGCYASDLLACFQFMACPTTPDGLTKDCSKRPDIVSNSWGAGQGVTTFDAVINTWHLNQIIPIFAGGNTGPSCTTITSPGDKANVITVGATDSNDVLASYSSKGPSVKGLRKPDVLAPGSTIRSSCYTGDTDYCVKSGTSMATPHVSGMVALYLARYPVPAVTKIVSTTDPSLNAPYADIANMVRATALTSVLTTATGYTCGGTTDFVFPNNQFGYGRLDAMKMLAFVPSYFTTTTTTATTTTTTAPAPTTTAPATTAPTATAPATTAPAATAPATSTCVLQAGADYTGNDIGSATSTTASGCCSICAATTGCKAFTWSTYIGGTCWLKSGKTYTSVNSAVTSGTI